MSAAMALELLRAGDPEGALAVLGNVPPDCAETAEAHGMALLAAGSAGAARAELDRAIRLGGASPALLLNRALAEDGAGDPQRARAWMRELAATYPDWAEPALRLGESLRRDGDPAALGAYEQALDRDGLRAETLVGLAVLLLGSGDNARAQTLLLRCCGLHPDNHQAWDALGQAMLQQNDRMAEAAFAEAQSLVPGSYDYALHRADAARRLGNAARELARLEVAGGTDPVALTARGVLLEHLGRRGDAIDLLEAAATLDPEAAQPALLLASLLARSPRVAEAEAALRRALSFHPGNAQLMNDLAAVLMRRHRHAEAVALLKDLRANHGADPTCLANLANATVSLGLQEEAETHARAAIALAPDALAPWRALTNILPYCFGTHASDLLAALRGVSDRIPREAVSFSNTPDPARKLRIGLLSGSFRTHPVGWLTVAGLETLDPTAFEITCLSQNSADPKRDAMAGRFRALATSWHDIDTLDDAALSILTRGLGLDILIDLGGYGDSGRMPACARRLAPVQIKWVGMQNHSTGLDGMDWFITDRWETPAALRGLYTERLLPLADGYVCYSPPPHAPDVAPLPALRNGHITFGCFNNLAKVTPATIATWAEILRAMPDARLVLKTHQFSDAPTCARVGGAFAAHGIAPGRLDLRGASPHREFMRQYQDIDLVLDPFPYTGGLTTCEALWMGVPVVTLVGEYFATRHSFGHLSNIGLPDWAANTREAYVDLALAKAGDLPALADLRTRLRDQMKASPLCDSRRFGANLGAALRHAWRDWCARR